MKALRIKEFENNFIQSIEEVSISELPVNEVLIKVHYSALNHKDILSSWGNRGITKKFPHTPGIDAAGVIEKSTNPNFFIGQKVIVTGYDLGMNTWGALSEYIYVPSAWVVPLPQDLSMRESMMLGTAGFTAAQTVTKLLSNNQKPEDGEIIITGATGGVGLMCISILNKLGFKVVALSSKINKFDYLKQAGASRCIHINEFELSDKPLLKPLWAGGIDNLGGVYLENIIKTTKKEGNIISIGMVKDTQLNLTVFPFILNGVNLLGINSADCPYAKRLQLWHNISTIWKPNTLDFITHEINLQDVITQMQLIKAGKSTGRILVKII